MSKTQKYRDQHNQLLKLVSEISVNLDPEKVKNDATPIRMLLSKLLGILSVHLAMEDKALYPKLMAQEDKNIKAMAMSFMNEMGGIGKNVNAYKERWPSATSIQKSPSEFIEQTKEIFQVLGKRIDRENNELYKAFDELDT